MSNNPLEAVTQAVNSLVTALKLPDESAKANEVLGEMSFPQFSRLLPYRDYNQESGLFMNDTTMGFMLEAIPINGANESIVEALDHMLRTKLPRGVPFCIHLMSSQLVGDRIEYGLREFSWSGEQAERFNAITRAYYMNAAATQFPLPEGMNLPLTLRHYRVFFSYCSPSKKKSRADILEMENLVKIIRASLQGASITTQAVDAQAFIDIVGEMINHNPDSLYPLTYWLNIITSLGCLEGGDLDIAYLSEIDPTWTDSSLTTILNPEAVIFANPIAQGACAADAIASAFNMPIDALFWCAGSQGSMYPFNGWVSNESSPLQSSLLVSERMAFKLHRQGMIMETIGKNNAVCNEYPSPILPKERWRYQMVNMYPDSGQCHPFGRSVTRWETGKNPPNTKKNFGYLMWRKRNCVFL
ncbi:conjugal transfer pilus assembly protein TraU [Escherichia coli]